MAWRPVRALVRRISPVYCGAYRARGIVVDDSLAREQHAAYIAALQEAGLDVSILPPDDRRYDCVFVEDTAVVWDGRALVTRMTEHREGEQSAVVEFLSTDHEIERLPDGARLEGGDVLHLEETTYAGLTSRTNPAGVEALRRFLSPFGRRVVPVPVAGALHLKSAATFLGDGILLAVPGRVDPRLFDAREVVFTSPGEEGAANCLRIGRRLLVQSEHLRALARLRQIAERHDVEIVPLDTSEFAKGDGSLTCLSILC